MSDKFLFERVSGPAPKDPNVINIDCDEIEAIQGMEIIPLSKSEVKKNNSKSKLKK